MTQALIDDDLWSRIEPLLPKRRRRNRQYAGRKPIPDRAVLTGILFVLRSGIPWNMLPREMGCGSGTTCWRRLVRWQRAGVWKRLHRVLLDRIAPARPARSGARRGRQCLAPRAARGKKTGPNPTDRRKAGSKHHVLTDAHGIPLVATLTAANRHDITQLLPLVDAMPPLRGRRRPAGAETAPGPRRPRLRFAAASRPAPARGASPPSSPNAARPHGSGLGRTRWVVERTLAWLHRFRRLAVRYERRRAFTKRFSR